MIEIAKGKRKVQVEYNLRKKVYSRKYMNILNTKGRGGFNHKK